MNRALLHVLLAATVAVLAGTGARTAGAKDTGPTRYAVLVGISKYADEAIKPRKHAEADVRALYKLLTDPAAGGIDKENVRLLEGTPEGDAKKATRAEFLNALKWVGSKAKEGDQVLFAFVGQGGPIGDSGDRRCYFLVDSTFKNRNKDAVSSEEVEEAFKKVKAKHVGVFLDVDFTGFKDEKAAGLAISEPTLGRAPYREFLGDDGSEDHLPMPGRVAFLATNGLSASLDLKDHGLFTTVLLEALQGKADNEGYEADGLVTVDEVAKYLNKRLPELARANGTTEKEKEQDHYILSGTGSHFVLAKNAKADKARVKRLELLAELIKDKKLPAELTAEAKLLLDRMPLLKKRQELRKAYQAFVDDPSKLEELKEKRDAILAEMKLKRNEALLFARKVLDAIDVLQKEYVKEVNPGKLATSAVRELYSAIEEAVPAAVEERLKKAETMREGGLLILVADARQELGQREDLENQKDLTITLQRMLGKLDPHTTYFDPDTTEKMRKDIEARFTGIGVQIRKDLASDQLLVVTPIKGSPAYKAGLWAGDVVTRIKRKVDSLGNPILDAQERETPTKGLSLNKAVKIIQGQAGTEVVLTIRREGRKDEFDVPINRAEIEVESVLGARRKADDNWDYVIDHKHKIGYIRLTSFARTSYRDLEAVMQKLIKEEKIKGFVLDLRFNPGGLLDAATKITDLFIGDGVIVSIRPRADVARETRIKGRWENSLLNFPMVCLVNGGSASGSEIVSAALQDHERARIIGERSYGKGSVQNLLEFDIYDSKAMKTLKAEIKLTTATFWRPSGKNLNKASTAGKDEDTWGVTPDTTIKLGAKERRDLMEHQRNSETIERPDRRGKETEKKSEFKDRQLDYALEYLRGQIKLAGKVQPKRTDS